jgi:MSHA biogenesis protein MshP
MRPETQRGFSLVAAIFLLVVLALLGALIASVTGMQQASGQLDLLGVRAYHAARAGMEWGAHQVLDPNNAEAACAIKNCPTSPTHLNSLGGSLSGFTVTVSCSVAADTTEVNRNLKVFNLVATACNQPAADGSCPATSPLNGYVSRQVQATVSKCKDPNATPPRCSCG